MNQMLIVSFLLTIMFFLSGIDKAKNVNKVASGLQNRIGMNLPYYFFFAAILAVIVLEIGAPLSIMYTAYTNEKKQEAYYSAIALALFTVAATYLYHFPPQGKEYYPFVSNVTTVGGLLLMAGVMKNVGDIRELSFF